MSDENKRSRIVLKIGEAQVEIEGEQSNVEKMMGEPIFKFIKGFQKAIGELPPPTSEAPEVPEESATEFPPQLGKVGAMSDAISALFKKDWGKKPRSLEEVMNVLEVNGLYYKKAAVATQLVRMMRKKEVRRFGARGSYKYVST